MIPGPRAARLAVSTALLVGFGVPGIASGSAVAVAPSGQESPALSASAEPRSSPAVSSALPGPPEVRCATSDPRLAELSGLAWAPGGLRSVVDSGPEFRVFRLAADCSVAATTSLPVDPRDVEDLARAPDGTLWLADVGDNAGVRDTVALLEVPPSGPQRLHRLTYPDGPHDAEALLLAGDGTPVIVTKELGGVAGVYTTSVPGSALAVPGPEALTRVGTVVPPASDTRGGPGGPFGGRLVTGGAVSPDGRIAVLRTYTDAWLYPVEGGDVAGALRGTPVGVPLPDEPQGEAVTLTPDGTLLSASESTAAGVGALRAVPGAVGAVGAVAPSTPATGSPGSATGSAETATGAGPSSGDSGGLGGGGIVAAVGVLVLGLVVALGAAALRRRRRR